MTTTNNSASDTEKIAPALIYTQVSSGFNVVPLIHTVVGVENEAYDAGNGTSHHLLFLEIQSNHNWHGILTTEKNDSLALNPEVHYPLDGSGNLKKAFACDEGGNYALALQAGGAEDKQEHIHLSANITKVDAAEQQQQQLDEIPEQLSSGITDSPNGLIYLVGDC